jgi:ADP-ribose pyrophosphatase YjhB (NUDIX family)
MAQITPTWHEVILWEWQIELVSFEVEVNGKRKMFERARRPPGVRVIIFDTEKNRILLSREYRREQGKYDYRLPGGKVIDTLSDMRSFTWDIEQEARDAAIREAREEVWVVIRDLELIHISHCGANIEWDLYYYLATDFDETGEHERDDEGESDLTTAWYTLDEVREKIISGEMSEDRSVSVILRWMMR